ncbi:MAG TPA: hypothetical protein VFF13_05870, partial [archaeon]|nr:hypothetical protein [archaeon]
MSPARIKKRKVRVKIKDMKFPGEKRLREMEGEYTLGKMGQKKIFGGKIGRGIGFERRKFTKEAQQEFDKNSKVSGTPGYLYENAGAHLRGYFTKLKDIILDDRFPLWHRKEALQKLRVLEKNLQIPEQHKLKKIPKELE